MLRKYWISWFFLRGNIPVNNLFLFKSGVQILEQVKKEQNSKFFLEFSGQLSESNINNRSTRKRFKICSKQAVKISNVQS